MPITENDVTSLTDADVISSSGEKIGSIGQVYVDDETGEPTFATVNTGLFGLSKSFVPLQGARVEDGNLVVNHDKETVKDAPRIDDDGSLSPEEEDELYSYYGLGAAGTTTDGYDTLTPADSAYGTGTTDAGSATDAGYGTGTTDAATGTTTDAGYGRATDAGYGTGTPTDTGYAAADEGNDRAAQSRVGDTDAVVGDRDAGADRDQDFDSEADRGVGDAAMSRSDEGQDVGIQSQETRRPRLRKYVVVESVILAAPLQPDEEGSERQPVIDENVDDATSGPPSPSASTR